MTKLMHGVGYNSGGKHRTRIDSVGTKNYRRWCSMIDRCYCPLVLARRPSQVDNTVAEVWHDFQNFAQWCEDHPHSNSDYHLDKDILVRGNTIYSPDTCCFIPHELNSLLSNSPSRQGKYLIGVSFDKSRSKFRATIRINSKYVALGRFNSELEAYQAYKIAKEAYVKEKALEWQGRITNDVFNALMDWQCLGNRLRGLYRRQEAAAEAGE